MEAWVRPISTGAFEIGGPTAPDVATVNHKRNDKMETHLYVKFIHKI